MPASANPALRSLKVEGLLSFGEETLFEFGRLNLLVGPNGSGKSNLIDCLRIFKNCPWRALPGRPLDFRRVGGQLVVKRRVRVYIEGGATGHTADNDFRRGCRRSCRRKQRGG
jgi:hypothetical protein